MTTVFEIDDLDNKVATALLQTLNAALEAAGSPAQAAETDEATLNPPEYVRISLSRRFGGQLNLGARLSVVGYRLTVTAVSRTYVANVRRSLSTCGRALEFERVEVDGVRSTPIQFESQRPAAPDDGWFSGAVNYTFAI